MDDYYQLLRVPKTASAATIRSAYRRLAKTCHPDLHPDDPAGAQRFILLTQAYTVLSDTDSRKQYDGGFAPPSSALPPQPSQEDIERFYRDMRSAYYKTSEGTFGVESLVLIVLRSPITYCVLFAILMLYALKDGIDSISTHLSSR